MLQVIYHNFYCYHVNVRINKNLPFLYFDFLCVVMYVGLRGHFPECYLLQHAQQCAAKQSESPWGEVCPLHLAPGASA